MKLVGSLRYGKRLAEIGAVSAIGSVNGSDTQSDTGSK